MNWTLLSLFGYVVEVLVMFPDYAAGVQCDFAASPSALKVVMSEPICLESMLRSNTNGNLALLFVLRRQSILAWVCKPLRSSSVS